MKVVIVTGGFDPIHSGHLAYFQAAKKLGNKLVVGLNSDEWLTRKKGKPFMPMSERFALVSALEIVDEVIVYNDDDGSSCNAITLVKKRYPNAQIVFANGGDRTKDNIPEMVFDDVEFVFGVGGENKANSSSWILEDWKNPKTPREWGFYRVLYQCGKEVKVKELTVNPGQRLSMQRHTDRAEHWFVAEGEASIYTLDSSTDLTHLGNFGEHEHIRISKEQWHQLCNETENPLKIIEIQYGENCQESDIERRVLNELV